MNIAPKYIGANGKDGATVMKSLHEEVYNALELMSICKLRKYKFTTETTLSKIFDKYKKDPYIEIDNLILPKDRYEIYRLGDIFNITKINSKGKTFVYDIEIIQTKERLLFFSLWNNKSFVPWRGKFKMRMYSADTHIENQLHMLYSS